MLLLSFIRFFMHIHRQYDSEFGLLLNWKDFFVYHLRVFSLSQVHFLCDWMTKWKKHFFGNKTKPIKFVLPKKEACRHFQREFLHLKGPTWPIPTEICIVCCYWLTQNPYATTVQQLLCCAFLIFLYSSWNQLDSDSPSCNAWNDCNLDFIVAILLLGSFLPSSWGSAHRHKTIVISLQAITNFSMGA